MPQSPLFLQRRSYRRRRIMDGLRMLPFLCAVLWLVVPAMWPNGAEEGASTTLSSALGYLFTVWVLAITASFALWRRLRPEDEAAQATDGPSA